MPDAQQAIGSLLRDLEQPGPTQGPLTAALALAAEIALAANDTAAASQLATRAVARAEKEARDPARSAEVGRLRLILGKVRLAQGDRDGARATIDTAVPALAGGLGPDHALTREARQLIATGGTR